MRGDESRTDCLLGDEIGDMGSSEGREVAVAPMSLSPSRDAQHPSDDWEWVLSDAWVLAAARVSGSMEQPAGLFDLVAACDAVNQLIVSQPELEHAMALLVGADLMMADENGIAVTESGRRLVARAGRAMVGGEHRTRRSGPTDRIQALFEALRTVPTTPVPFQLDPRTYEAACLEYRHTRWNELRRTGRRF